MIIMKRSKIMKKFISLTAAVLLSAAMLPLTVFGKDTDSSPSETSSSSTVSPMKGPDDFYVRVKDRNGDTKIMFYMCPQDGEEIPTVYMDNDLSDPDSMFGYVSVIAQDEPAKNSEVLLGDDLKKFFETAKFDYSGISYNCSERVTSGTILEKEEEPARYEKLKKLALSIEPEFSDELKNFEPEYDYDVRYPVTGISFSSDLWYTTLSSGVYFSFARHNDRTAAKVTVYDYSELEKVIKTDKYPISPEELTEAYSKTTHGSSDWFYLNNDEFYSYAITCIVLSGESDLENSPRSTPDSYYSLAGFSDNIAKYINVHDKTLENYNIYKFGNICFELPAEKEAALSGDEVVWTSSSDPAVKFRIYNGSSYIPYDAKTFALEYGKFNNVFCSYRSVYIDEEGIFKDVLSFYDNTDKHYNMEFTLSAKEKTDEYKRFVKDVFGSISLYTQSEKEKLKNAGADIKLSSEPVIYADTSEIAISYSYGSQTYKAGCPGVIFADFYIADFTKEYETGFDCYIERQAADGKWYRVEPLGGKIIQANNGYGQFYDALQEARKFITLDLAAYPLLPQGKYRAAKPFWEKGNEDHEQYFAFYEFYMDEKADLGEPIKSSAKCGKKTYSPDTDEITYTVDVNDGDSFIESDIIDIERKINGKWTSVRKTPVHTNSIGGSYALRFSGMEETVETDDFDISQAGEYRLRISIGEFGLEDLENDENMFVDNYSTAYAYFKIK